MKSKVAILSFVSLLFAFAATAQEIESDDMYFNSKDRAKLKAAKASAVSYSASIKTNKKEAVQEEPVNPTDSYSARNVNPEYSARSNSELAQSDNQDYFVDNYRYNQASNFNNWNNSFNNWYGNPWYSTNYWGSSINSWNSPYYGSYYDSWGNPWANPYYQSGWSSSFSYHWGSSYNYGWGMNFGYGNFYGSPYYAYNPYYGRWNSYYGGGWGYPTQVVIIENGSRYSPAYGKRSSRSSQLSREYNNGSTRTTNRNLVDSNTGRPNLGGRVSTNTPSRGQSDYYNRGWRNQTSESNSSYSPNTNSSSGNTNTRSSWENSSRNTWRESNSNSGGSYTPSRGSDSGRSAGSGSSGGSSGGSSSGSGSRSGGRGH